MDKIGTNEYIGGTVQVGRFGEKNERQDCGGLDMYKGNLMGIFGEGC